MYFNTRCAFVSLGLISIFLFLNFFYWGVKLASEKIIKNFITKIFFTLTYIVFGTTVLNVLYNESFWLIDNGNGGFVGAAIKEKIYYFSPLIEHQYVIYILISLTVIFFILSLGITKNEDLDDEENVTVCGWDAILSDEHIAETGIQPVQKLTDGVRNADAVLILNNHRANVQPGLFVQNFQNRPKLVFDGWNQLDPEEIDRVPGLVYATMGYMGN